MKRKIGQGFFSKDGVFRPAFKRFFDRHEVPVSEVGDNQSTYFTLPFRASTDSKIPLPAVIEFRHNNENRITFSALIRPVDSDPSSQWNKDRDRLYANAESIKSKVREGGGGEFIRARSIYGNVGFWKNSFQLDPLQFKDDIDERVDTWMCENRIIEIYKLVDDAINNVLSDYRKR